MEYNKISQEIIAKLQALVGAQNVLTEGEQMEIYAHDEVISILKQMADLLLPKKVTRFIDDRLHLVEVKDGQHLDIDGFDITFFDIHSTKAKQFGFSLNYDGKKLTCCGDEPYNEAMGESH